MRGFSLLKQGFDFLSTMKLHLRNLSHSLLIELSMIFLITYRRVEEMAVFVHLKCHFLRPVSLNYKRVLDLLADVAQVLTSWELGVNNGS